MDWVYGKKEKSQKILTNKNPLLRRDFLTNDLNGIGRTEYREISVFCKFL